jgi:hypothetical protein
MSNSETIENEENTVFFQKMNIRDLYGCASCGNGLHITIPAKLVRAYDIEPGDELLLRIEEVRYGNLREIKKRVSAAKLSFSRGSTKE